MQLKKPSGAKTFFISALLALAFLAFANLCAAQTVVDKTVATVSDNIVKPELITYSDLLWELALQAEVPINPPSSADLNRALQSLINQRLIALEAKRLPNVTPGEAEVKAEIQRVLKEFPSTAEFEKRLRLVGFDSITDDNFQLIMQQRVLIENYLTFRFRSFVVVTPEDEARFYREVYVPEFRRRNPGVLLPPLEEVRARINTRMTERKIAEDIEKFLEDAKSRAEIEVLFEV